LADDAKSFFRGNLIWRITNKINFGRNLIWQTTSFKVKNEKSMRKLKFSGNLIRRRVEKINFGGNLIWWIFAKSAKRIFAKSAKLSSHQNFFL